MGTHTCNTQGKALQDGFAPLTLSPFLLRGSTMLPGEVRAPRHCNDPSGSLHRQEGKNGTEIITVHVHLGKLEL